ncbi:PadR family transcriptional regulator [Oerskovia turbata]|uniref:PadR family transcriptional regulator n=1 Tax=Oerskovia turbata TaxID=1713 RepID=A0A4Q1L2D5_9CELL|nr:PadR family transcriptional regulator [Oerskovia turbata]RXR26890.1 PadR family transcriptional regulator [Oerskovia turbata]RXR36268.1 PadR family transcriptional regulator [Oerskovia turbata]
MRTPHQHPDPSRPPRDRSGRAGAFDPFGGRPRRRRDDFPQPEGFGSDIGGDFPGGPRGGRVGGPDGGPRGRGHRGPGGRVPGGRGPGGRAGRGDVRAAILLLLAEEPMHGYQVIQEIGERTSGTWRPSPGAIYPALSLLEDEGLVTITAEGGRKLASLTDDGRTYVTEHADELGTPWQDAADGGVRPARQLRGALQQVAEALRQVARSGSDEQTAQAVALLERTRRELYLILAGPAETPDAEEPPSPEA